MRIGVTRETAAGERRVALAPSALGPLKKAGFEVVIESGAGMAAGYPDPAFETAGGSIASSAQDVFRAADVIARVRALGADVDGSAGLLESLRDGQGLIALTDPLWAPDSAHQAAARGISAFSLELVPRITRAQGMDVLSSQASLAGYKAVILAAAELPKIFPLMMTAAGTITPARVLVIGAGVAGLQAIATAKRLGALVSAYDVRPAVKEQVESLGARFVSLPLTTEEAAGSGGYARAMDEEFYRRQAELMGETVAENDVVITTAAVPGAKAPILITRDMVARMAPGSVIIDLAAERGGNCEITKLGERLVEAGVVVLGPANLPSSIAHHASQVFGRNMAAFLLHVAKDGKLPADLDDEIIRETLVTYQGEVVHPRVREKLGLPSLEPPKSAPQEVETGQARGG